MNKRKHLDRELRKALEEEDERLTSSLFPTTGWAQDDDDDPEESADLYTFEIDRTGDDKNQPATKEGKEDATAVVEESTASSKPTSAWTDPDDVDVVDLMQTSSRLRKLRKTIQETTVSGSMYEERLRERFQATTQSLVPTEWAQVDDDDNDNSTAKLISAGPLLAQKKRRLPATTLDIKRCTDLNQDEPNRAVVQSVHFHPGSDPFKPIALTAGLDKTLRFFQVTEEKSEKIHGLHFPSLPIASARFLGSTGTVVVSGRRPYFFLYDSVVGKLDRIPNLTGRSEKSLEHCFAAPDGRTVAFAGNDGFVLLFDVKQKHLKSTVKLNGQVRAVSFSGEHEVLASGTDGDVYRFDMRTRRCLERFANQDGGTTTTLAASERHMAVGSQSGVVNLYTSAASTSPPPREPLKAIMNLRTTVTHACFNHDGNLLAISSGMEKDALKVVHVPTATVFSNWPTSKTPLQHVSCTDFSPDSRFLAVGNDKGKCMLYKLHHYTSHEEQ